jgi:hypothetical protein
MSALGHKQTFRSAKSHVRFTPESGHWRDASAGLLRPGLFSRILGLKDVKLSLKAAEIGERHLIQPRPVIATKDLAVVARMIKNSLKS